jgi:hypothetical protein
MSEERKLNPEYKEALQLFRKSVLGAVDLMRGCVTFDSKGLPPLLG